MSLTSARKLSVLDVDSLKPAQLAECLDALHGLQHKELLPVTSISIDSVRRELDSILCSVLEIDFDEVSRLARRLADEPIVHGRDSDDHARRRPGADIQQRTGQKGLFDDIG